LICEMYDSKRNFVVVRRLLLDFGSRGRRQRLRINLVVERDERRLRILVEASESHAQRLLLATEDRIRLADVDEATSRDDIVERSIVEPDANGICPLRKAISEVLVHLAEGLHSLEQNALLDCLRRVVNLEPKVESVEHCLVHHASTDETTIIGTLALRVASRNDVESQRVGNLLNDAVDELALAFEWRLKAHRLGSTAVHLVKEKNSTTLECDDHRAVLPLHRGVAVTVDESPSTDERILVGHLGEVDAQTLALQLRADLLNHLGLARTSIARENDRCEDTTLNDLLHILEVTERNIVRVHIGNERSTSAVR